MRPISNDKDFLLSNHSKSFQVSVTPYMLLSNFSNESCGLFLLLAKVLTGKVVISATEYSWFVTQFSLTRKIA